MRYRFYAIGFLAVLSTFIFCSNAHANTCKKQKTWKGASDWEKGITQGLSWKKTKGDIAITRCIPVTQPPQAKKVPVLYIPNSNTNTLVKMYTRTGKIDWTYHFTPLGLGSDPSRMAIDHNGNVWVGLRSSKHVIVLSSKGKLLATVLVGETPRALTTAKNGDVWIGTFNGKQWIHVSAKTFKVISRYRGKATLFCPYGATTDHKGDFWIVSRCGGAGDRLYKFSGSTGKQISILSIPHIYGVVADPKGQIWVTASRGPDPNTPESRFHQVDSSTNKIIKSYPIKCRTRGVTLDRKGRVWFTCSHKRFSPSRELRTVLRFDPSTQSFKSFNVGSNSIGMTVDYDGFIWSMSFSEGRAYKQKIDGSLVGSYPACDLSGKRPCFSQDGSGCGLCKLRKGNRTSVTPYAYSHMASFVLEANPDLKKSVTTTNLGDSAKDCKPNKAWVKSYPNIRQIATGPDNILYFASNNSIHAINTCTQKILWTKPFKNMFIQSLAVDFMGNLYIAANTGIVATSSSPPATFDGKSVKFDEYSVTQYSPEGSSLWFFTGRGFVSNLHVGHGNELFLIGSAPGIDHRVTFNGKVVLTNSTYQTYKPSYFFKIDTTTKTLVWANWFRAKFHNRAHSTPRTIHIDKASQSFYVVGNYTGKVTIAGKASKKNSSGSGHFLLKISADGTYEWVVFAENTNSPSKRTLTSESTGKVYWALSNNINIAGRHSDIWLDGSKITGRGSFVIQLSPQGKTLWSLVLKNHPQKGSKQTILNVIVDKSDQLYISGNFVDKFQAGSFTHTRNGPNSFVTRIDPSRKAVVWSKSASGYNGDLRINHYKNLFLSGRTAQNGSSPVTFDKLPLVGSGNFLWKLPRDPRLSIPGPPMSKGIWRTTFDAGCEADWKKISWIASFPKNSEVKVRIRSASTEKGLANGYWSGFMHKAQNPLIPSGRWIEIEVLPCAGLCLPLILVKSLTVTYVPCQCRQKPPARRQPPKTRKALDTSIHKPAKRSVGRVSKVDPGISIPPKRREPASRNKPPKRREPASRNKPPKRREPASRNEPPKNRKPAPPSSPPKKKKEKEPEGQGKGDYGSACSSLGSQSHIPAFPLLAGLFLLGLFIRKRFPR